MNWKNIQKKYPKAYTLVRKYGDNEFGFDKSLTEEFEVFINSFIRNLFDFFDSNSLYISIQMEIEHTREIDEDGNNPHYAIDKWMYAIHDNSFELSSDGNYTSRDDAEITAFTNAFELLNDKLNCGEDKQSNEHFHPENGYEAAKQWLIEIGEWNYVNTHGFSTDGWSIIATANAMWENRNINHDEY